MNFTENLPKKNLYLLSLGCTKNLVDSEVMLKDLDKDYVLSDDISSADLLIVNTCGFIQSAKEESINALLDLHEKRKKSSILVMAGCLSQRYKEELKEELKEVDIFTGVGDYDKIASLVKSKTNAFSEKVFLNEKKANRVISGSNYHAYVKISEGCNQACAFCAIPSFKGKLNSRSLESIEEELKDLVTRGFYDFSFIAQDSSSYLKDKEQNDGLVLLISMVEKIAGIKSARILYLYPKTTSLDLIKKIQDSKIFHNYFDIPLQHSSQKILKDMKRPDKQNKTRILLEAMKGTKDAFIRSTFIVGFPNESEEDFKELCDFVKEFEFSRANVFCFSAEEGTSASLSAGQISSEISEKRAEILGEIIEKIYLKNLEAQVGKIINIVVDGASSEHEYLLSAKELCWAPEIDGEIYVNDKEISEEIIFGKIYKAKITELSGKKLLATVIA